MIRQVLALAVFFIGVLLFFFIFPYWNEKNLGCREETDFSAEAYNVRVVKKFIDSENHNFKKLIFQGDQRVFVKIFTGDLEYPGFYSSINVGDSVIKVKGQLFYTVISSNGSTKRLDFHSLCKVQNK